MFSQVDHRGETATHGYTVDDNRVTWYWEWNGETLEFTDRGVPTDHPIREAGVPDTVRAEAEACVGVGG